MTDTELNALVATEVLGWHQQDFVSGGDWPIPYWFEGNTKRVMVLSWWPTKNIADAWLVVEKMRDWCFTLTRERHYAAEPVDGYYAVMGASGKWAETAPRAICLAALAAVGVEVLGD